MVIAEDTPTLFKDTTNGLVVGSIDSKRELLGYTQNENGKREYYVKCSVCREDPELYKDGIFIVGLREMRKVRTCGCTAVYSRGFPETHIRVLIERECKEKGYTFNGFVGDVYKGKSKTYLDLTCSCGHSWTTTRVTKLLDCNRGCPSCAGNIPWDKERFLIEAALVHGTLYDYSLVTEVKNSKHKVSVICKLHGDFLSDPHHHIDRSQGCPHEDCVNKKISEANAMTHEDFIVKAKNVHGDKYDYADTTYTRSSVRLDIFCNACEKPFQQTPTDHLSGCGCPHCAGRNQKQSYIFSIGGEEAAAFKFGIANVYTTRFRRQKWQSPLNVNVLGVWEYDTTQACKDAESYIINNFECGFLTKAEYPDGFSETLPVRYLDDVIKVYEDFGGRRAI